VNKLSRDFFSRPAFAGDEDWHIRGSDTFDQDGFRFDLASIFSRNNDGSINLDDPPLISEITGGAEYSNVRLIAEAWDPASYELGRSFPRSIMEPVERQISR